MIIPCKYCGRNGYKVTTGKNGEIKKDKCIYCNSKGYTIKMKGGNKK